jgi:hypothetical protein
MSRQQSIRRIKSKVYTLSNRTHQAAGGNRNSKHAIKSKKIRKSKKAKKIRKSKKSKKVRKTKKSKKVRKTLKKYGGWQIKTKPRAKHRIKRTLKPRNKKLN